MKYWIGINRRENLSIKVMRDFIAHGSYANHRRNLRQGTVSITTT